MMVRDQGRFFLYDVEFVWFMKLAKRIGSSRYQISHMQLCSVAFFFFLTVRLRGLVGNALDHRSLPPVFESRVGHI